MFRRKERTVIPARSRGPLRHSNGHGMQLGQRSMIPLLPFGCGVAITVEQRLLRLRPQIAAPRRHLWSIALWLERGCALLVAYR